MAEILPNGTIQGYFNTCPDCKETIEVNIQGTPRNHKCKAKTLPIPVVIESTKECTDKTHSCYPAKYVNGKPDCDNCEYFL